MGRRKGIIFSLIFLFVAATKTAGRLLTISRSSNPLTDIEKYFPDKWPTQHAITTYWYLNKEGKDPVRPTSADELYGWEIP